MTLQEFKDEYCVELDNEEISDEENLDNDSLEELLDRLSDILDNAYEYAEDDDEKDYICRVEDALRDQLRKAGLIK